MVSGFSIRYRIPLIICGVLLAVTVAYAMAAYHQAGKTLVEASHDRIGEVATELSGMLGESAVRLAEQATEAVADPVVQQFLGDPRSEDTAAVRAALLANDWASNLVGIELRHAGERIMLEARDGEVLELTTEAIGQRIGDGPVAVGGIHLTPAGARVPVIAQLPADEGPPARVIHWYRLVGSAAATEQIENLVGSNAQLFLGDTETGLWTDLNEEAAPPPMPLSGERQSLEYSRSDEGPRLAAVTPVNGTPWTLIVEMPRAVAIAPARQMLPWLVLIGLGLLLLGGLGAWYLSRNITVSIGKLAGAADAISAGEYAHRVRIPRSDELGSLARAFNTMGEAVEEAHENLEHKVTELGTLEESHRETSEKLNHVVSSSPSVIYSLSLDRDGASLSWISENVDRILGYEPSEALAEGWWLTRLHPEDRELLAGNGSLPSTDRVREYRFLTRDGDTRWLRDEQRVIRDASGRTAEVVGALSDITERRQLEEQFRRSQKMEAVGRLAGGVAHDFNNLLTVILGEAELAALESASPESVKEALSEIRSAGDRASHLTRQLLAFSSNNMVETSVFAVNDVVRDIHAMLRRLIGEDVALELRMAPDAGHVKADRGQIEQVLVNLVVNAHDATPAGGRIVIETAGIELDDEYVSRHGDVQPGPYVALCVSDTGEGMTEEVKSHLFEPFFTTKPEGKGTGLGLATSYAIVGRFGGHIEAYSEVGVGTTMKMYLPRSRETVGPDISRDEAPISGGSERILVVEDDDQVRAITVRILRGQGYDVIEAKDGEDALVTLEDTVEIDLLLTDVIMPRMGGRELAARARALRPDLRILFASGYSDEIIVQNRLLEDDMSLVQKPFTRSALTRKIRDALDRPLHSA